MAYGWPRIRRALSFFRAAEPSRGWRTGAALLLAYAACAVSASLAAQTAGTGPGVWMANGVLAAALLVLRPAVAVATYVLCALVLVGLIVGTPAYHPLYAVLDLLLPLGVTWLARRTCGAAVDLTRPNRLRRFALVAALAPNVLIAAAGALLVRDTFGETRGSVFTVWFLTDYFGVLVGATAVLSLLKAGRIHLVRLLAGAAVTLSATGLLFATHLPLALILPVLLLVAFRLGPAYCAPALASFVAVAVPAALLGEGPWILSIQPDRLARAQQLHLFLALALVCTLPVSAVLAERERDKASLARRTADARAARRLAETATRARSRFLAMISHELRTPLNSLEGFGQLLAARPDLPADVAAQLASMRRASELLSGAVDDILEFTRAESGKIELVHAPFAAADVVDRAMTLAHSRGQEKGLTLRTEIAVSRERRWMGDERRLVQVVLNLLTNAIKFTPAGEVVVSVHAHPSLCGSDELVFEVRDTGPGIAAAAIPTLFQPFVQADAGVWRAHGGAGLGLAICKNLLDQMGGTIRVASEPGHGAAFRVTVPAARAAEPEAARAALRLCGRVLVVDDEPLNREVAMLHLRNLGLQPSACADGRSAVDAVRDGAFDLVLMDIGLPELDGVSATREIRALPGRSPPVVALSAYTELSRAQMSEAGFADRLYKPLNAAALAAAVRRCLA